MSVFAVCDGGGGVWSVVYGV